MPLFVGFEVKAFRFFENEFLLEFFFLSILFTGTVCLNLFRTSTLSFRSAECAAADRDGRGGEGETEVCLGTKGLRKRGKVKGLY